MPSLSDKFINDYLPAYGIPFFNDLKDMFCPGMKTANLPSDKDPVDLAIHCPNVIRCLEDIFKNDGQNIVRDSQDKIHQETKKTITKIKEKKSNEEREKSKAAKLISKHMDDIKACLGISEDDETSEDKVFSILKIAALYHDIGKKIRPANHPRLGVNILRHSDQHEQEEMIKHFVTTDDKKNSKSNEHRFSSICSIVDHHDKFGVVSTGEASVAIFSDILYFRSDENAMAGIKKNITSIMLITLADIAAVCSQYLDEKDKRTAQKLVFEFLENESSDHKKTCTKLHKIWLKRESFIGLNFDKVTNILEDWKELIDATKEAHWDRTALREYLIHKDQNPYRTIKRIIRLIKECCYTTNCEELLPYIFETDVESTLISIFGSHQFKDFCAKFAYIVKMDYGLKFFKGILCACVRKKTETVNTEKDGWLKLNKDEQQKINSWDPKEKRDIINSVSKKFIKIIREIIYRYNSMFELKLESAYRFGLQMRNLTEDANVRKNILDYLCILNDKEEVALTWIADEVTFWSMD